MRLRTDSRSHVGDRTNHGGADAITVRVTALTLAPSLLVLMAVPESVDAAMPGVEATVTVDGAATGSLPGAPLSSPDGVMDVSVALTNDVGATADVSVNAGWAAPCNVRLLDGEEGTCAGFQYRPTQLGTTSRQATVTTQAEWDALDLGDIDQLAFGEHHGCAVDAASRAWCWGTNSDGRVGDGSTVNRSSAAPVAGPVGGRQYMRITTGQRHTCALDTAGAAWCWGSANGCLGNGSTVNSSVPVQVSGTRTFGAIAAGDAHTCVIAANAGDIGKVFCWGQGTLGDATRAGYLTAYPCSSVPPSASNVNYDAGRVVANSAIVQLGEQGDLCLFSLADTDVLVDVTGYLAPR